MEDRRSLDTLCAALAYAIGTDAPEHAAVPSLEITAYIDSKLSGKKVAE